MASFPALHLSNSVDESIEHWKQLTTQDYPFDRSRLFAIEQGLKNQVTPIYLITHEDGATDCYYFQHIVFRSHYYQSAFKNYRITRLLEKLLIDKRYSLLVAGNLIAVDVPAYHPQRKPDFARLEKVLSTIENKYPSSITVLKDIDDETAMAAAANNFVSFGDDLTMALTLDTDWQTFDDYVSALKHKYAQRTRKLMRDAAPVDRQNLTLTRVNELRSEISALLNNVTTRQKIRIVIPTVDYFASLMKTDPGFSMVGYFDSGRMVGFTTYFNKAGETEMHYIGLDYEANARYHLYFNMLFDGIATAIKNQSSVLELGRTARQAKVNVGAKPVYFISMVRFNNRVARAIYNNLRNTFSQQPGTDWQERHPFKST